MTENYAIIGRVEGHFGPPRPAEKDQGHPLDATRNLSNTQRRDRIFRRAGVHLANVG